MKQMRPVFEAPEMCGDGTHCSPVAIPESLPGVGQAQDLVRFSIWWSRPLAG